MRQAQCAARLSPPQGGAITCGGCYLLAPGRRLARTVASGFSCPGLALVPAAIAASEMPIQW